MVLVRSTRLFGVYYTILPIWWDSTITVYSRMWLSNIDFEKDNIVRLITDVSEKCFKPREACYKKMFVIP